MNILLHLRCLISIVTVLILLNNINVIAGPASSGDPIWVKIDDFEAATSLLMWQKADTRNDTQPKLNSPQVTERRLEKNKKNYYLIKKPAPDGIVGNRKALTFKALPMPVSVGEIATFYTRINVEAFPNNHVFGLSNLSPEDIKKYDYNAFEPSLRITDKRESSGDKNDGTLMVKETKGYSKIKNFAKDTFASPLQEGVWYELWYVVNNQTKAKGGQVYDVYLRGGNEFSKQTLVYKNAKFRMARELPLIYFLANCNTGPVKQPYGNGGLWYDDLYMSSGRVLTTPLKRND